MGWRVSGCAGRLVFGQVVHWLLVGSCNWPGEPEDSAMTDKPITAERLCVCCRYPIHPAETGLRHYGNGTAHSDDRCIWILEEEIRRLRHENANARQAASSEAENCEVLEKAVARLIKANAEVADINAEYLQTLHESNAVCACGCPIEAHENYGEDGMSCPAEGHDCLPTSKAVLSMLERLREDLIDEQTASDLHAVLNRRAAKALGKPVSGKNSTWHDIPEQIEALRETVENYWATMLKVDSYLFDLGHPPESPARKLLLARLVKP
jgi:hypothetical protein